MRSIKKNNSAAVQYISLGIVILVLSALAVPIVFSVNGAFNAGNIDTQIRSTMLYNQTIAGAWHWKNLYGNTTYKCRNATDQVITTTGTVLGLNPLAALVAVAAGMIFLLAGAFMRPGIGGV